MKHSLTVFDLHVRDWRVLQVFPTESDAEAYLAQYPRFGSEYSRTIRQGGAQVIPYHPSHEYSRIDPTSV